MTMEMNQQNMMQQFYDQPGAVNGYPAGFQPNQQMPMNSYNNPNSASVGPFMNPSFRQQNGLNRFSVQEGENFNDGVSQNASNQGFPPNYMNSFDPRSRPNFENYKDGFSGMPSIDGFNGSQNFPGKPRMPQDMSSMFANPAQLAAYQRQRMAMFGPGRENDFLSPTAPFGGFTPQQIAQQQRFSAALQRQAQQEQLQQMQQAGGRPTNNPEFARQFFGAANQGMGGQATAGGGPAVGAAAAAVSAAGNGDPASFGSTGMPNADNFAASGGVPMQNPQRRSSDQLMQAKQMEQQMKEQQMKEQMKEQLLLKEQQKQQQQNRPDQVPNQTPADRNSLPSQLMNQAGMNQQTPSSMDQFPGGNRMQSSIMQQSSGSGSSTPKMPFETDSQRQAAFLAAQAVQRAAAASSRNRTAGGLPPSAGGLPNGPTAVPPNATFPMTQRGFAGQPELMGSPFQASHQNMTSPASAEFGGSGGGVISPNKDLSGGSGQMRSMAASPMSAGRLTPRNGQPPPYSPMPTSAQQSDSGSVRGSYPNLASLCSPSVKVEPPPTPQAGALGDHLPNTEAKEKPPAAKKKKTSKKDKEKQEKEKQEAEATVKAEDESMCFPGTVNNVLPPYEKSHSSTDMFLGEQNQAFMNQMPPQNRPQNPPSSRPLELLNSNKLSAPPTPGLSPSPSPLEQGGGNFEALSPSWPQTPDSPNAQKMLRERASPHQYDQLSKIYAIDMNDDDEKRNFYDRYLAFMSVNSTPITKVPIVGKKALDLYTLFRSVIERGGIQEVMEKRRFREILHCLSLPTTNAIIALTVKNQYMKYLHTYEAKMKDVLMKQWKNPITLDQQQPVGTANHAANAQPSTTPPVAGMNNVPTIALNDSMKDAVQMNKMAGGPPTGQQGFRPPSSGWDSGGGMPPNATNMPPNQFVPPPRIPFYNQQPMQGGFMGGQEQVPPGYPPNNYGQYPHNPAMYQRQAGMGGYGPMGQIHPGMGNDPMTAWPRGYPPRQGPPELFPEGLNRMPWSQPSHPMGGFANRSQQQQYQQQQQQQQQMGGGSVGKQMSSGRSRDPMEQLKLQQQQQMKLAHAQQQAHAQRSQASAAAKLVHTQATPTSSSTERGPLSPVVSHKREHAFPPHSVESTKPALKKRKKLTSKDLGPVEAWRIMMSLKSGLAAECTWAIDTLNILLSDNTTITYFDLTQLPGLIDTLMDHYRRLLRDIFGLFKTLEIDIKAERSDDRSQKPVNDLLQDLWVGICKNASNSYTACIASISVEASVTERLEAGSEFWLRGGGDDTSHIQVAFPSKKLQLKSYPVAEEEVDVVKVEPYADKSELEEATISNDEVEDVKPLVLKPLEIVRSRTPTVETSSESQSNCKLKRSSSANDLTSYGNLKLESLTPTKNCFMSSGDTDVSSSDYVGLEILDKLILEAERSSDTVTMDTSGQPADSGDTHPVIEKLKADLEFNIDCDRKYLHDSREFIGYLTRRLRRENRGRVESDESTAKQMAPLSLCDETLEQVHQRLQAMSNVFRSMSYLSENDGALCQHIGLMLTAGHLLLHGHEHPVTDHSQFKLAQDGDSVAVSVQHADASESWWETLDVVRENTLVMLSNVAGQMNLSVLEPDVRARLVRGLVHWVACPSSKGQDAMPTASSSNALSPRRMAIETLAKLSINVVNVAPVMEHADDAELEMACDVLVQQLARKQPIPTREFCLVLIDNLSRHSERFAVTLAGRRSAVANVVKFVQEAEKNTSNYLSAGGRVQPGLNAEDICGTSISLLRRSVNILLSLSQISSLRRTLLPHLDSLLSLSTSQMIDTSVLALLAQVLYEVGQ